MQYKTYAKAKDTPSRMARKHARREVFLYNKKIAKTARKNRRLSKQFDLSE